MLADIFKELKTPSLKVDSYFANYEELLSKYRDSQPTVVEVGVLSGGSLHMWKKYFGEGCRIIGIDANPEALKHHKDGIEIYIFNQEDVNEWDKFFRTVGMIDVLIDDGGHTSFGQIVTCISGSKNINNGGIIVVEDVHSSYAKEFGMPNKYSFDNWTNELSAELNTIYLTKTYNLSVSQNQFLKKLSSIHKYRSLTAFKIKTVNPFPESVSSINDAQYPLDYRFNFTQKHFRILGKIVSFQPINIVSVGNRNKKLLFLNTFINSITIKIADRLYTLFNSLFKPIYNLELKKSNRRSRIYFK